MCICVCVYKLIHTQGRKLGNTEEIEITEGIIVGWGLNMQRQKKEDERNSLLLTKLHYGKNNDKT